MQNFSSLASTQTDLDKFLTIVEEISRIFQENSLANSKKIQIWVRNFIFFLGKHVHANFSSVSSNQTDLDNILSFFQEKFQDFLEENLEFSISEKSSE
jgi:hypothetical protein